MLVVKDHLQRVVWIDFDRVKTYEESSITDPEEFFLEEEELTFVYFKLFLISTLLSRYMNQVY